MFFGFENNDENELADGQCPTGRVFQNRVGYWKQIPGSRLGSSWVGVLKYIIADCIFQLSYPIIGYLFYSQVFSNIPQFW